jgi:hypothetical protein
MTYSLRKTIAVLCAAAAVLSVAVGAAAQATQTTQTIPGAGKITTAQTKGEVIYISGNYLVAKMIPGDDYRLFYVAPGRTASIDGVVTPLSQIKLGTILTAYVTTTERSVVDRTVATLKGTVWWASPTAVILTLENGENREYEVPKGMKFDVDGQMKEAMELKPGLKITATKITEAPRTEFSTSNNVIGTVKK